MVIIELKKKSEPFSVDQEEWYEKAFGPKQNIMDVRITFQPETKEHLKKNKNDIYAEVNYEMFDEMVGEFHKEDHQFPAPIKLNPVEYDQGLFYFEKRLELPYGTISCNIKVAGKATEGGELNLTALPDGEKYELRVEPEPQSLKQL